MITTVVVAHPDRHEQAGELAVQLEAWISLDEDGLGASANHRRALAYGLASDADHILVLEDDALPVDGLLDHVGQAITERPSQIIGLYVGRQRPRAHLVETAVRKADDLGASWLTSNGLLWGVANVWPREIAKAWLAEPEAGTWDSHARRWCRLNRYDVAYTWPSLVDHQDGPSVVADRADRDPGRVAWRVGIPQWNDVSVAI